ncbi:MAG TPA: phosphopyruvate hydratase [Ilumatobacter sp.]|nr:phosphopyruvate hydratase [Ilumatobacter sp.]
MDTVDTVRKVWCRKVWDSRGRPTVEVEITAASGAFGRAIAPSGASTGSGETLERRDGGQRLGGYDVMSAVAVANSAVAAALVGGPLDQQAIDNALTALNPRRDDPVVGGNVMVATSFAAAHAIAASRDVPLWQSFARDAPDGGAPWLPLPEIQIFGGGAHAEGSIDIQDVLLVAPGARSFGEAIEWTNEVYLAAGADGRGRGVADEGGWWPNFGSNEEAVTALIRAIERAGLRAPGDVAIALDLAATQFYEHGKYALRSEGRILDRDRWIELIAGWCRDHPIVAVEDPLHEDDVDGHRALRAVLGSGVLVVGDDLLVTDPARVDDRAGAADALLMKPNQAGTLTTAREATERARGQGMRVIASARSGETEDVTLAHLAVGWRADLVKVGSVTRGERTAKWNELLRIEEHVTEFAGSAALPASPDRGGR